MIEIRRYRAEDLPEIQKLFYDTVHSINRKDYSFEEVAVWAPCKLDSEQWNRSLLENYSVVAVEGNRIVGFGDIERTNYLNRLYVHKDRQGMGIATAICHDLEKQCEGYTITVHASITAKPFFEKRGYRVVKEQQVKRGELDLTNFVMEKVHAEIRLMNQKDDREIISGIYEESWKAGYRGILPQAYLDNIQKGSWCGFLENPEQRTLVMIKDHEIIGTSAFGPSRFRGEGRVGEIISIYLLPQYFGKGYGRGLLQAALDELAKLGHAEVDLWVLEENIRARRFYEAFGFVAAGEFLEEDIGGKNVREMRYVYKRTIK